MSGVLGMEEMDFKIMVEKVVIVGVKGGEK